MRYEKLERSFMALNHRAAAIIAFRKVPLAVNIIYGSILSASRLAQQSIAYGTEGMEEEVRPNGFGDHGRDT